MSKGGGHEHFFAAMLAAFGLLLVRGLLIAGVVALIFWLFLGYRSQ